MRVCVSTQMCHKKTYSNHPGIMGFCVLDMFVHEKIHVFSKFRINSVKYTHIKDFNIQIQEE